MRKARLYACFLLLLSITACSVRAGNPAAETLEAPDTISVPAEELEESKVLSLAFVGDVMMATNFPDSSYITKDRGRSLFKECKQVIRSADIAIANLEGTMYDGPEGELRECTNPDTYYIFRTPADHADNLVDAGFDAVGIANNHSNDFGTIGRRLTQETLKGVGLGVSGVKGMAEECILERDGVKYGFLQFAASCRNTLDLNNEQDVEGFIGDLRKKCDILIVTFHGGAEGAAYTSVPKETEYYVGENRGDVHQFAHRAIDLGADIVVGHGPHVPRAMELYKGHLIAYSLGNFCTPFRMNVNGICGMAPLLVANLNQADGTFVGGQIHSYRQRKGAGPRADLQHGASRFIRTMTNADFPDSGLKISDTGEITLGL